MRKLILISFLVSVAVAELNLFPDSALLNGFYDEDAFTQQIFGDRERRDADAMPKGDKMTPDVFGPQMMLEDCKRSGPPPPRPPPQAKDGQMCPPLPRPENEESSSDDPPPPRRPPPPHHEGGEGPPRHGGRHQRPKMVRCCNVTVFNDDEISKIMKECRDEMVSNSTEKGPHRGHGPGMWKNLTECTFEKMGWVSGRNVNVQKLTEKMKQMPAMDDTQEFWTKTFENCGEPEREVKEFCYCVHKEMLTNCPAKYEATQCTEECAAWKEKASKMK